VHQLAPCGLGKMRPGGIFQGIFCRTYRGVYIMFIGVADLIPGLVIGGIKTIDKSPGMSRDEFAVYKQTILFIHRLLQQCRRIIHYLRSTVF